MAVLPPPVLQTNVNHDGVAPAHAPLEQRVCLNTTKILMAEHPQTNVVQPKLTFLSKRIAKDRSIRFLVAGTRFEGLELFVAHDG